MRFRGLVSVMFVGLFCAHPVNAQDDTARIVMDTSRAGTDWNAPRVLAMIQRAATRRTEPQADTALHNYKATAEGFVYFFLDRPASEERTLVRVNQIGLELYWRQPGVARQRIAGMRDASPLPNTMRYHLDHLTMVQNGFGDVIRMGDGDEVSDVTHPASERGRSVYEYRLADSLDLQLPSMRESIRVYEVQVRPRNLARPGFVGSLFIDRTTSDIIRMTFTFTPSSYVDKRLDYINLSLDNGLWDGRYWLPNEQTVEIRRQLPELDFVAGSVIRGRMRITDYALNADIPDSIFRTQRAVIAAPPEALASYVYKQGIFEDIGDAGLAQPPEMARLRAEAAQLIGARFMSGLPDLRLYFRDASSAIRYNRAEGLFLGAGVTYSVGPPWRYDISAGYAFGSSHGSALGRVTYAPSARSLVLTGYTHALRDLGPVTTLAGVANSLSSLALGRDYLDPWYVSGADITWNRPVGSGITAALGASIEKQLSADRTQDHAVFDRGAQFRDVRSIDAGTESAFTATLSRVSPAAAKVAIGGALSLRAASFNSDDVASSDARFVRALLRAETVFRTASQERELRAALAASFTTSGAPIQTYVFAGGTGTLPGYAYRSFVGRAGAVAHVELTQRVLYPWVGIRAVGAAGAVGDGATDGVKTSLGTGASLLWDLLHIDAVKGMNGGKWVIQLSFSRSLDDIS